MRMQANPEKSQTEVFRAMCSYLSTAQRQLHADYQSDRILRDQIVRAVDREDIMRALRERVPASSQDATHRVAALLAHEPGSAAYFIGSGDAGAALLVTPTQPPAPLRSRFGGEARRRVAAPGGGRKSSGARSGRSTKVKGCWVCGQNHFARDYHSSEDIRAALLKHKEAGRAYVLIEDVLDFESATDKEKDAATTTSEEEEEDQVQWAACGDVGRELIDTLYVRACTHGCAYALQKHTTCSATRTTLKSTQELRPNDQKDDQFKGFIFDTGANRYSVMSLGQLKALARSHGVPPVIRRSEARRITGFGGGRTSMGACSIELPLNDLGIEAQVSFQIFAEPTVATLISLRDMRRLGLELSLAEGLLLYNGRSQKLDLINDFLVLSVAPDAVLYTEKELRKLHGTFGHPSVSALARLLRRARPDETPVYKALQEISTACTTCAATRSKPRRFKLTVGSEDCRFNHVIAADVMFLDSLPVLHVVDEATHFAAARFISRPAAKETWDALVECWISVYTGPPDFLRIDQGSNFMGDDFITNAQHQGITLLPAPVEAPTTMTHVERYHAPLRAAYVRLRTSLPNERKELLLQLAVKANNDTVGPEGLTPSLLVFGSIPKPARHTLAPTSLERARAIDDARKEVNKAVARSRVQFGLRHRGPVGGVASPLDDLMPGAHVRVYRTDTGKWEGPYTFVDKTGETVCVQMPSGRKIFRSTAVQVALSAPGTRQRGARNNSPPQHAMHVSAFHATAAANAPQEATTPMPPNFPATVQAARTKEIAGLLRRGTFEIVPIADVPARTRIYKLKFVDTEKVGPNQERYIKSRLVAQNYRDAGAATIPTRSPTVTRWAQRLLLLLAALFPELDVYLRDISQSYTQSTSALQRNVYLRPPADFGLIEGFVLRAALPLYGIPESGLHWFVTYHDHHVQQLQMVPSPADPCFLTRAARSSNNTRELREGPACVALQVDDTLGLGSADFLRVEADAARHFESKPRAILSDNTPLRFNGVQISRATSGTIALDQTDKFHGLCLSDCNRNASLISLRARVQYVASCTRPDLAAASHLLAAEVSSPSPKLEAVRDMDKLLAYCKKTATRTLNMVHLDRASLRLVLFTDAAFANAKSFHSQIGFVLVATDDYSSANILHWGSQRAKRITRSVMGAELLALAHGFDQVCGVKQTLEQALNRSIPLDVYVDSRTVFNTVAKTAPTLEKRLQIDAFALRQAQNRGDFRRLGWIEGNSNPTDGLTRKDPLPDPHPLIVLMETNTLKICASGWIEENPNYRSDGEDDEVQQTRSR